jgi:dCTP deaminase
MTVLSDCEILDLLKSGVIEGSDPRLVNPASLDVRLGPNLMIESVEGMDMLPLSIAKATAEKPYELVPGQFVLAETLETFHMPEDLAAQFALKSSRAREGLEHLLAGWIDPGFGGSKLTLELKNARQLQRIPLWPGMRIGQIVFMQMRRRPLVSYSVVGHYNGQSAVAPSLVAA